jgi:hypothetical protein
MAKGDATMNLHLRNVKRNLAKLALIAGFAMLLSQSAAAFAFVRVAVGFGVNAGYPPPPVPVVREVVAPCPGPGYVWVGGHWGWRPVFARYAWVRGAWAVPPYAHAYWVGPRFVARPAGRVFIGGYWARR